MRFKTKLSLGLGFLFFIIFALAVFCSYSIEKLSQEASNILKDNYNSIVYARNMISALDDTRTSIGGIVFNSKGNRTLFDHYSQIFESAKGEFEKNLNAENNNITEINEKDQVDRLNSDYAVYSSLSVQIVKGSGSQSMYFNDFLPAYEKVRRSINRIDDINMQAVVLKSQATKQDSTRKMILMAVIGSFCIILAFGYFWYFPFYISNTISYLSDRMKNLLSNAGIVYDIKTKDEAYVLLHAIDLLENRMNLNPEGKKKG